MILRFFRAIVHDSKQNEFQEFFLGKALPNIPLQPGLMSVSVGLPGVESSTEFSMVMVWRDLDALKAFTGGDWRQAVIDPAEVHLLKATHLYHYNLAEV